MKVVAVVIYLFILFRMPDWLGVPATPVTGLMVIFWGSIGFLPLLFLVRKLHARNTRSRTRPAPLV